MNRYLLVFGVLAFGVLMVERPAFADWMGMADFTDCPRQYVSKTSGEDGPFATEAACKAHIEKVQRAQQLSCARYSCVDKVPAAAGGPMDGHIADAIAAGLTGEIAAGDAAGLVTLGVLGNALLKGSKGASTADLERAKDAERQRAVEAKTAASSDRLLAEMLPEPGESSVAEQGFMSEATVRVAPRNQPRAVIKEPVSLADQLMEDPEPVARESAAAVQPQQTPAPRMLPFDQGLAHGRGCFGQNAGTACSDAAPDELVQCRTDYLSGYEVGRTRFAAPLLEEAYQAGVRDRPNRSSLTAGSRPDASGPCSNEIHKAYNAGLGGWPRP